MQAAAFLALAAVLLAGCVVPPFSPPIGTCPQFPETQLTLRVEGFDDALEKARFRTGGLRTALSCAIVPWVDVPAIGPDAARGPLLVYLFHELRLEFAGSAARLEAEMDVRALGENATMEVRRLGDGSLRAAWNGTDLRVLRSETLAGRHALDDLSRDGEARLPGGPWNVTFPVNSSWNRGVWAQASPGEGNATVRIELHGPDGTFLERGPVAGEPGTELHRSGLLPGTWTVRFVPLDGSGTVAWSVAFFY
ncbi:MAG TPA: hypothetical protein VM681_03085 [Candidatus Thermoplasmatota archaeon]|nr:hypothetical protein [Candidatus Thermoplasmatota archaeon]